MDFLRSKRVDFSDAETAEGLGFVLRAFLSVGLLVGSLAGLVILVIALLR